MTQKSFSLLKIFNIEAPDKCSFNCQVQEEIREDVSSILIEWNDLKRKIFTSILLTIMENNNILWEALYINFTNCKSIPVDKI